MKTPFEEYKENIQVEAIDYSDKEKEYSDFLLARLTNASNQRNDKYTELDDMDFLGYYDSNRRAANSYLRPKKNESDVRMVTGTTLEKENTLLAQLINYNFDPNVETYDKNDEPIARLGEIFEDFIKKSRIEDEYDRKRPLIYKEMADQGTCFVEEIWEEPSIIDKEISGLDWSEGIKVGKVKWKEKLKKSYGRCTCNLLDGKKVFLGNVYEFDIKKQPYIFTVDYMPYEEAKMLYGKWDRWKYVGKKLNSTINVNIDTDYYTSDNSANLDIVEIVKYQDKYANEYMITLNGVMMLPTGFPLTAISPSGDYNVAKGDMEAISQFFAYSKSIPAKTKVDQAIFDEFIRLMVLKTQQSFKPPMVNNTGRLLSQQIFDPGSIWSDINAGELTPLLQPTGVTAPEFNALQFVKSIIDDKSFAPIMSGQSPGNGTTATEVNEMQKQGMTKMGLSILGVVNFEKQLCDLRLHNIMAHWTRAIDNKVDDAKKQLIDVYRKVYIEKTNFDEGIEGTRVVEMTTDDEKVGRNQYQIEAEEDLMKKHKGGNFKKVYLNPEVLRSMVHSWYITINPTQKNSDQLDRVLFTQNITQGFQLFGPQGFNLDYVKNQWAVKNKLDPEKLFVKEQPQQPAMPGAEQGMSPQQSQMMPKQQQQPSINTLKQAV